MTRTKLTAEEKAARWLERKLARMAKRFREFERAGPLVLWREGDLLTRRPYNLTEPISGVRVANFPSAASARECAAALSAIVDWESAVRTLAKGSKPNVLPEAFALVDRFGGKPCDRNPATTEVFARAVVQMHSARDHSVTELGRALIVNTDDGTQTLRNYDVCTFRGRCREALNKMIVHRNGRVTGWPSERVHVWNLVAKALAAMGYGDKT